MTPYRSLFGPVPSRRFGRSLGVDLTPLKTCCYNCIFCQLGNTDKKTLSRREYIPVETVTAELNEWRNKGGRADYITLSGSGEPTLHTGFGQILRFLEDTPEPTVLLTNGALLTLPEVREDACRADVVKISLSAWDQRSFETVNRPHDAIRFNDILKGFELFRAQYTGSLQMEIFLLLGINAMPENVKKIAALVNGIGPDNIHLNTVVRPPAEEFAAPVPASRLTAFAEMFNPPATVIADFKTPHSKTMQATEQTILAMLQRRPCTMSQITAVFDMNINEVSKYLGNLMRQNRIRTVQDKTHVYYTAIENSASMV